MTPPEIFAPGLFEGRHAFITGGGTGIGLAIAKELGRLGAKVTIAARDEARLTEATDGLKAQGIDAAWYGLNIRDVEAVERIWDRLVEERGLPDYLVNNAGGQFGARALDISPNGFRAVMDLNVQGTWQMSSAFAHRLVKADKPGRIINIVFAHTQAMVFFAHAAAARAAVVNLTQTLALEWGEHGILVNAVGPGPVQTEAVKQYTAEMSNEHVISKMPVPRPGEPYETAYAVAFLLSPAGDWITGILLPVDGGAQLAGRRLEP
jgi:NAD(P)-dependent dehydrogenase (short-subunit alcohol dehydrogenase family)